MKKKRNIIFTYPIVLLTAISLQMPAKSTVNNNGVLFLSPKSNLKTSNNNLFKYIYETILKSNKDISDTVKNELLAYIQNDNQLDIKDKIAEFFPTNPKIYQDFTWTSGFSLLVGFNAENGKVVIIPASKSSGKDTGLKQPLFTDIDAVDTKSLLTVLVEEKHEEMILKEYILKSGIETIGGFLFNTDTYDKHKILNIYTDLFLAQNPKKTLYYLVDNTFEIDNPYAINLFNKVTKKLGADKTFSLLLKIMEDQHEANSITNNASNIILHIINQTTPETIFEQLNKTNSDYIQTIISKLADEFPKIYVKLAELFLIKLEDKASPFIKNQFIKNIPKLNKDFLKPLVLELEYKSKNENVKILARNFISNLGLNPYKNIFKNQTDGKVRIVADKSPSQLYEIIKESIYTTKNSALLIPLLESLNAIEAQFLPDTITKDILLFIDQNPNIHDLVATESLKLIAKKNNNSAADTILDIITDPKYSPTIKKAAVLAIASINSQHVFDKGMELLINDSLTQKQKLNILTALNNTESQTIDSKSWIKVANFLETNNTLSPDEIARALALIVHINNTEGIDYILEEELYYASFLGEDFSKLLKFMIGRLSNAEKILEIGFYKNRDRSIVMAAFNKLNKMLLNKNEITKLFNIMIDTDTSRPNRNICHILIKELMKNNSHIILPLIEKTIYDKEKADDFLIHMEILDLLELVDQEDVTQNLVDMLVYADKNVIIFEQNPYSKIRETFTKLLNQKKVKATPISTNEIKDIIRKFTQAKNEDEGFDALIELDQATDRTNDKSYIPTLMHMLEDTSMLEDELIMIGKVIAKGGYKYKQQMADFLMPKLMNPDDTPDLMKESYSKLLKLTGFSHKLLLWKKTRMDWQKFGISSADIAKGYLHATDKKYFINQISEVINTDNIYFDNINWNSPSQYLVDEEFFPIKSMNEKQFETILNLLYSHMDTKTNTDIVLGEEYEIVGRKNIPAYYYRIFEESNDENEIITPPSNPLYQKIFSRNVPSAHAGVHRTLEQRVNNMDAKLINLFCQLYSLGKVSQNIIIGKELNPKETDLWSIRYNNHEGQSYGDGKFLLQTTDWKTHTSGSLMWFFMNYADKYPLKWVKLKDLLLKKLSKHNINIYEFGEDSDEKRVSIQKKHKDDQVNFIPKYIYDLTKTPDNENNCIMRLLVNDKDITDALSEMILYTSDDIVQGSVTEKKLYAIDVLNELYQTVARGEIPDNFAHYRPNAAMENSLKKIEKYFQDKEDALDANQANNLIKQAV